MAFLLLVVALAALVIDRAIFAREPIGGAIQAGAVALMLWARRVFGERSYHIVADPTPGGMMASGPFRYWRHPIYAGALYFIWVGVASHWNRYHALLGCAITATLLVRVYAEEYLLKAHYPEYAAYMRTTKRLIPGIW